MLPRPSSLRLQARNIQQCRLRPAIIVGIIWLTRRRWSVWRNSRGKTNASGAPIPPVPPPKKWGPPPTSAPGGGDGWQHAGVVAGTLAGLEYYLLDGGGDSELKSELMALGHLIKDHVERRYHSRALSGPVSAAVSTVSKPLANFPFDGTERTRLAQLLVDLAGVDRCCSSGDFGGGVC